LSDGRYLVHGIGENGLPVQEIVDAGKSLDETVPSFRLPAQAASLIARALLDAEPASERLTNKLESLLDREAERVDRLIGLVSQSSTPTS
jgi:hypothetical protein